MAGLIRCVLMILMVAVLAVPCLAAAPAKMSPITKGFGSAAWGEDVSRRKDFLKLRSDDGVDYFVNLRETYVMQGYGKPTVFYGQSGGRLYAAYLRLNEDASFDKLAGELSRLYGHGKKMTEGGSSVVRWKTGPVRVKLKKDPAGGVKLSFYYQPVAVTLSMVQREAEPASDELTRLLPSGLAPVQVPAGALPPKQEDYVGIDVLKYLREGSQLLKLEKPKANPAQ
ncbi:MAG: hypothetical protein ACLGSA_07220 [Acidobacteriota bacterium]